jgi:2-(1,2-epoxy-1,2-dihydrophenyl)acetyl-CoA isomerase
MGTYEKLLTEQAGGVMTITLSRPKANAFDFQMTDELLDALRRAAGNRTVRCLVLTGSGRSFSAGQDVVVMRQEGKTTSYRQHLEQTFNRIVILIRQMEKLVIGAINGAAAGAGLGIALATDLRIAAESARFVFGFTILGLAGDSGVSLFLPALVGLARATEMAFTNAPLSAQQALDFGLVNRVVPDDQLMPAAADLATALASGPTQALALTKRAFNVAALADLEAVLHYEGFMQEIASRTADHQEGIAAFLEKRIPSFRGE